MKETMKIRLGSRLRVTDPCYGFDTDYICNLDIVPGIYECKYEISESRVSSIEIHLSGIDAEPTELTEFEIGVDSGQCGFFDEDYYNEIFSDDWYDRVCNITLSKKQMGVIDDRGFVSSSGYGDGCYNLYAGKNPEGKIASAKVLFIHPRHILSQREY